MHQPHYMSESSQRYHFLCHIIDWKLLFHTHVSTCSHQLPRPLSPPILSVFLPLSLSPWASGHNRQRGLEDWGAAGVISSSWQAHLATLFSFVCVFVCVCVCACTVHVCAMKIKSEIHLKLCTSFQYILFPVTLEWHFSFIKSESNAWLYCVCIH